MQLIELTHEIAFDEVDSDIHSYEQEIELGYLDRTIFHMKKLNGQMDLSKSQDYEAVMTVDMQVEIDEARYSLDTVMDANLYKYEELFDYSGTWGGGGKRYTHSNTSTYAKQRRERASLYLNAELAVYFPHTGEVSSTEILNDLDFQMILSTDFGAEEHSFDYHFENEIFAGEDDDDEDIPGGNKFSLLWKVEEKTADYLENDNILSFGAALKIGELFENDQGQESDVKWVYIHTYVYICVCVLKREKTLKLLRVLV